MRSILSISAFAVALTQVNFASAAASSGCGLTVPSGLKRGGTDSTNSLIFTTSSGIVRQYALHIPTTYDINTPAPLTFSFHGRGATAAFQESSSQMSNETWNPNYFVVYPTGINLEWQGDPDATSDDVSFTLQLIANLSSTYCLDSSRIFAAGKSNGGGFAANVLACDPVASRQIAAFAGMSGAFYQGSTDVGCSGDTVAITCNPGRAPVPILETHGSADGTIPYTGGPRRGSCLPTIPRFMTDKGQRAGIGGVNTSTSLYNGNVLKYTYGNNASLNGVVTHYWVNGMDHIWPTISATYFDATPILFDFFNTWTLDKTPITILDTTTSSSTSSSSSFTSTTSTTTQAASTSISTTQTTSSSVSITQTSSTSSSTTSSASAAPTTSAISCPANNGQTYTATNGATFLLECGIDHSGGDMSMVYVKDYAGCVNACATTAGCVDVSLSGVACYMKKTLGAAVSNSGILGAKLIASAVSSSSTVSATASSIVSSSTSSSTSSSKVSSTVSSSSSSSLSSTLPSTSSSSLSSTSSSSSSSTSSSSLSSSLSSTSSSTFSSTSSALSTLSTVTSSTVSSSTSGSVGADGYTTTTFPPTCTAINTNIYAVTDSSGLPYLYMCGGGSAGNTVSTVTNVASWTACYAACDSVVGCTGFTYNQGANFGAGVGQCLIKTGVQSFASTATLLSTRIAGLKLTVTTTTSSSALTSSSVPVSTTAISTSQTSSSVTISSSSASITSTSASVSSPTVSSTTPTITSTPSVSATSSVSASSSVSLSSSTSISASSSSTIPTSSSASPSSSTSPSTSSSTTSSTSSSTSSSTPSSTSSSTPSSSTPIPSSSTSTTLPTTSSSTTLSSTTTSSTSSTTSSSTTLSSTITSSTSSTTSSTTTPITPLCPSSNGTIFTEPNGSNYTIICSLDTSSTSSTISGPSYPGTFAACASLCDGTSGCTSISWIAGSSACYLLASLGGWVVNAVRAG